MAFSNLHLFRPLLRFPHWARVRPIDVSCTITVQDASLISVNRTMTVTELSEQTALALFQKSLAAVGASQFDIYFNKKGVYTYMLATSITVLMARLYHYPTATAQAVSCGINSGNVAYAGGFGSTSNDDFARVACETLNPWNAYSAAKAWELAPWGGPSASEIVYPYDQTLPKLALTSNY